MRKTYCSECLVALLFCLSWCASLSGQTASDSDDEESRIAESHLLTIVPMPEGDDPAELLQHRLLGKRNQSIAERLQRYGIGPKVLDELKHRLETDKEFTKALKNFRADDPRIPKDLRDTLKQLQFEKSDLQSKLNPELIDDLKQRLKSKEQGAAGSEAKQEKKDSAGPPSLTNQSTAGAKLANLARTEKSANDGEESDGTKTESPVVRSLLKFAQGLARMNPDFEKSPALQKAVRDLSRHMGEPDQRWQLLSKSAHELSARWATWSSQLRLENALSGRSWPARLTSRTWPSLRARTEEALARSVRAESAEPETGPWRGLFILVALAAAAWAAWKLFERWPFVARRKVQQEWDPGPWPVDPAQVASRGEVVQAFEYLALLILGPAARSRNHRALAEELGLEKTLPRRRPETTSSGGPSGSKGWFGRQRISLGLFPMPDERRLLARELANIYEQARYSPPADTLPEDAVVRARRDLCRFAGVSAA